MLPIIEIIDMVLIMILVIIESATYYRTFLKKKRTYNRKPKFIPKVIKNKAYDE